MRVDPNYVTNLTAALDQSASQEDTLTSELSSGLRVASLSDDPVAAAQSTLLGSSIAGGDLGGVLEARDQELPSYQNALDSLAFGIGTQVNQQNELGVDANGNPGAALFSLPSTQSGAAALIGVATTDPNAVAAASPGEGSAGNANASALADLSNAPVSRAVKRLQDF